MCKRLRRKQDILALFAFFARKPSCFLADCGFPSCNPNLTYITISVIRPTVSNDTSDGCGGGKALRSFTPAIGRRSPAEASAFTRCEDGPAISGPGISGVCPEGQRQGSEPAPLPPRTQGRVCGIGHVPPAVRTQHAKPSLYGSGNPSAGQPVRSLPPGVTLHSPAGDGVWVRLPPNCDHNQIRRPGLDPGSRCY